ncbi:hypothetical protein FJU08_20750 [Martelella alba]|uniref:Uncharacterized protein n=1 Tax=Martelella alba TaxID=2590451 RepID=A0A506U0C2_9HYPH|nr:hypothetical protein [Martelella alba]TPW27220.1 hypothetical protein FJU08_20750 [Martelella alba]
MSAGRNWRARSGRYCAAHRHASANMPLPQKPALRYKAAAGSIALLSPALAFILAACTELAAEAGLEYQIPANQWQPFVFADIDQVVAEGGNRIVVDSRSGKSIIAATLPLTMTQSGLFKASVTWTFGARNAIEDPRPCGLAYSRNDVPQSGNRFRVRAGDKVRIGFECAASRHPFGVGAQSSFAPFQVVLGPAMYTIAAAKRPALGDPQTGTSSPQGPAFAQTHTPSVPLVRRLPPMLSCPAFTPSGGLLPLNAPAVEDVTKRSEDTRPVPQAIMNYAMTVLGNFEAGAGNPYAEVSALEGLSLGYFQWNAGRGTLYTPFLSAMTSEHIALAPSSVRPGIETLHRVAKGLASLSDGTAVIADWRRSAPGDPLVRGIRRSVRAGLSEWLALPSVVDIQKSIMLGTNALAYSYARQWLVTQGITTATTSQMRIADTYFLNMLVHVGGRNGMWQPHAHAFRESFSSDLAMMDYIALWLAVCQNNGGRRLYNVAEARKNALKYASMVARNPRSFTDNQFDLYALAFQLATHSIDDNDGAAFPGFFQAEVLLRFGVIIFGAGTIGGMPYEAVSRAAKKDAMGD